ncbi:MAG: nucleotidyltransferase domain-containing protein [Actinomycetota bacterium]
MGTLTLDSFEVASAGARIVDAVEHDLHAEGVILCGSRAIGDFRPDSDYDVFAVLPAWRIPFSLGAMRRASEELSAQLGAPVRINPLPAFRLRRPGRSFIVWKAFTEGRILSAPAMPHAIDVPLPSNLPAARSSYAISGLRALLHDLELSALEHDPLPELVAHGVEKALLHAAQLELLRHGRYAPTMERCLPLLERMHGIRFARLSERTHRAATWFEARELLLPDARPPRDGFVRKLLEDGQFLALSVLACRRPPGRVLFARGSVQVRSANAVIELARAIEPRGAIAPGRLAEARRWSSSLLRGHPAAWEDLRDAIESVWPQANPLVGV